MEIGSILGVSVLVLAYLAGTSSGHICIIDPQQRGPLDISKPGSHVCAKHDGPCGGMTPQTPKVNYVGGSTVFVRFQQNLNHYDIGFPGYIDISIATSDDVKAAFHIEATIGDKYEYSQAHQHNYSIPINVPNIQCDHCVLRMRYITHKPGDMFFYQCADISISKAPQGSNHNSTRLRQRPENEGDVQIQTVANLQSPGNVSSAKLLGFAWNPERAGSSVISVDTFSGEKIGKGGVPFGVGPGYQYGTPAPDAQSLRYVVDQVACYSREIPYVFMLEHHNGDLDSPPNKIIWLELYSMDIAGEYEIQTPDYLPISSLNPYQRTTFLAFQMEEDKTNLGNFTFKVATLDYMGVYALLYKADEPEALYVNFLWATVDLTKQLYYVLMGNENSPFELKSRIYTYDIGKQNITHMTEVDVSQYTISAIQVYEKTGQLFAMSPGLFGDPYPAWTLIEVNPMDGTIKKVAEVAKAGNFEQYYGGSVINLDQKNGVLYYVLRVADNDYDVIAAVSLEADHRVVFSKLTNLRNIHNLALYDLGY